MAHIFLSQIHVDQVGKYSFYCKKIYTVKIIISNSRVASSERIVRKLSIQLILLQTATRTGITVKATEVLPQPPSVDSNVRTGLHRHPTNIPGTFEISPTHSRFHGICCIINEVLHIFL